MGKTTVYRHSFNVGEKSITGLARVDQESMALAAEVQENLFPRVVGAAQFRPGTKYIGASRNNAPVRLIPFVKATDDTALLELTTGAFRVWINDALVTRPSVTSTVTNGTFDTATGWTLSATSGNTATISGGVLTLAAPFNGGSASCSRSVTTSSAGTEHALRIVVTQGPVTFKCGSTSTNDDYIFETDLETGVHSLAFIPTASPYYVSFATKRQTQVTIDSITVESAGVMTLTGLPWAESELEAIRYDQSNDIIFLAHYNWQQRKIERRGLRSWSVVLYKTDDGPFTLGPTSNVRIKPDATQGNTQLWADGPFFRPEHVGTLFRLYHEKFDATFKLGGDAVFTDTWRVSGIKSGNIKDRDFTYTTTGTWSGRIHMQRSITDATSGFADYPFDDNAADVSFITNQTNIEHKDFDANNNVIAYHRLGFKTGNYTSGNITIAVQYDGYAGYGICRVTQYNSPTNVAVEVLSDFKATSYTNSWQEGEWSDNRGWPSAVAFYDGRLFWARDDQFWASISDQFYSYTLDEDLNPDASGDAGSIQKNIATGSGVATVNWMLPLQRLIFGTSGAETSARSSSFDEPLSPDRCTLKDASTQGSAPINPVKIDGRGLFVQRSGTRVYELGYSVESNDYSSRNLMRLNEEIGLAGIKSLAVQRQPETYVWMIRADGQVPILLYDTKEEVAGFIRFIPGGWVEGSTNVMVEDVVVLPGDTEDAVYLIVKRLINGQVVRYLEKLAARTDAQGGTRNYIADSFITAAGPASSITAAHLAGQTGLVGWATNGSGSLVPLTGLTANGSGVITLDATYTNIVVGIKYSWRYKSAKLAHAAQGTPMSQPKIVKQIGLHMLNFVPAAIKYGRNFTDVYSMPGVERGVPISSTAVQTIYDEQTFPFGGPEWDTDARICLKGDAPYPVTLLGVILDMQVNE